MLKRIVMCAAMALCMVAPSYCRAADEAKTGQKTAQESSSAPEVQAPLLPSTLHEAEKFFLQPAIWTIVIFGVMLIILYPTAWKGVLAGLKKREDRIRNDIAEAEAARAKAEATLKEYSAQLATAESRVREMLSSATHDGEKLAAEIRAKAQSEAEDSGQRAVREIEAAKKQAIVELYERAAELSTNVAEKILRRSINADDQRDLVRQSLDELETVGSRQ